MRITIFFESGRREYIDLVTDISMCQDDEGGEYVSVTRLNMDTCYYENVNWKSDMISHISCKIF